MKTGRTGWERCSAYSSCSRRASSSNALWSGFTACYYLIPVHVPNGQRLFLCSLTGHTNRTALTRYWRSKKALRFINVNALWRAKCYLFI